MARASTRTLLSLDRFAQIVGIHPLHFNQVQLPDVVPTTCDQPVLQHAWQAAGRVGREELAQVISEAEDLVAAYLGYKVLPTWEVAEWVDMPRQPYIVHPAPTVKAKYGYALSGGIEAKSKIVSGAPVVYSDEDLDSYFETATIAFATSVTEPEEIALYYPGEAGADEWEIRPINVSIVGGVATVTCRREQLVQPDVMESYAPRAAEGTDDGNFLNTVDAYRHYHDPSQQVQFLWEGHSACRCGLATCPMCYSAQQYGCLTVRNARIGLLSYHPGLWSETDQAFAYTTYLHGHNPTRGRIWYRAGWRDMTRPYPELQMDPIWEQVVSRLALALTDKPLCGCSSFESRAVYWREDLALISSSDTGSSSFKLPLAALNNPIGTTRAAVYAWQRIQRSRLGNA